MRKILLAILAAISLGNCIFAGAELAGTTSINFEKICPYARAAGMGEAFTAISDGTYGLYYNPAGIAAGPCFEAQFSHIGWFQGMNYEYISLTTPSPVLDNAKIGFALALFTSGVLTRTNIMASDDAGYLDNYFSNSGGDEKFYPYDISAVLGYGIGISPDFSAGIRLKYDSQNIDGDSGSNLTADLGLLYRAVFENNTLRFGADLKNIGTQLKINNTGFDPPLILDMGISDTIKIWAGTFLTSAQVEIPSDYQAEYSLGFEFWFYDMFALRLGYGAGAYNRPTFGAGIRWNGLELDYAYINYDELGATNRISILYNWGSLPVKLKTTPKIFSPNNDGIADFLYLYPVLKSYENLKSLAVNVFDATGIIKLAKLAARDKTSKIIKWDGKAGGVTLPDGTYRISISAVYGDNNTSESNMVNVEIDNTPPVADIDAGNKPQDDEAMIPVNFNLHAKDKNLIAGWKLSIYDAGRKMFFSASGLGSPPHEYVWNGKDTAGFDAPKNGIFYYDLSVSDIAGNKSITKPGMIRVSGKEIKIAFSSDTLFDLGQVNVKISAYGILKTMKDVIDKNPGLLIKVTGYTDNIPPQGIKYNNNTELSKERAEAVKFFMINLLGYDAKKIITAGYGELYPVADNDSEQGRQKNRRVEITLYR